MLDVSTFDAIAEPNRRALLEALRDEPQTVTTLVQAVGLSQPAVSKHLKVLREVGLVTVRPDGQRRWYEISPEPLAELEQWLEPFRVMWSARLDAFERHLDNSSDTEQ